MHFHLHLFRVHHGSVPGSILFTIYAFSIGYIARIHGLSIHLYAHTHLYKAFNPIDHGDTTHQYSLRLKTVSYLDRRKQAKT